MMTLQEAATVFNTITFTDLLGANEFLGQLLPYTDNTRSGSTSRRRILEVAPTTSVPEAVIDTSDGTNYLVADRSSDSFQGSTIRDKYPIVPTDDVYTVSSVYELLSAAVVPTTVGLTNYNRREPSTDSSTVLGGFSGFVPASIDVEAGDIMYTVDTYYRVKEDGFLDDIGLNTFEVIRVRDALQTLSITTGGTFHPVTEEITGSVTEDVLCFVEERDKSFELQRQDASKDLFGDMTISTLHDCEVGDIIGEYQIISKRTEDSVNILHCRAE